MHGGLIRTIALFRLNNSCLVFGTIHPTLVDGRSGAFEPLHVSIRPSHQTLIICAQPRAEAVGMMLIVKRLWIYRVCDLSLPKPGAVGMAKRDLRE